jgi:HEAT repeat protein
VKPPRFERAGGHYVSGKGITTMPLFGLLPPDVEKLYTKRDIKGLVEALRYRDHVIGASAAEKLGELGDSGAVEPLIAALKDTKARVREAANRSLGKLGDRRAVEPIIAALKDSNVWVRTAAASALGELADVRAIEPLMAILKVEEGDASVLNEARRAMVAMGASAIGPFMAMLKEPKSAARRRAEDALKEIGSPAVEALIEALKDNNRDVRWTAVNTLGQIGDRRAVEPLTAVLQDEDSNMRWNAIRALGNLNDDYGNKVLSTTLVADLAGNDLTARQVAVEELGRLRSVEAVEALTQVLKDKKSDIRKAAAKALMEIGDTRAVESLIVSLADVNADVRRQAGEALGVLGDKAAITPLIVALKDKTDFVRAIAGTSLRKLMPLEEANKLINEAQYAQKRNELKAVRKYLSHLAINWWAAQPESRTTALCDACGSRDIKRNDGYLIGSSLWCDSCYFEKNIESQIEQDPERSLGRGVYQKALEMFEGDSE